MAKTIVKTMTLGLALVLAIQTSAQTAYRMNVWQGGKSTVLEVNSIDSITFTAVTPESDPVYNPNANANQMSNARGWEVPHLGSGMFINHTLSNGLPNYCMEYSDKHYHARWVAYRYDRTSAQRNTTRSEAWAPEPDLDDFPESQVASHLSNGQTQYFTGYNRGHLVGSAERYYSAEANKQTFYMSNMSPMLGAFNTTYWGCVEDLCRDKWGRPCSSSGDTLFVVKGGTLEELRSAIPVKNTLGDTKYMAVPKYYFMACVRKTKAGKVSGIAFLMEHKDYGDTSDAYLKQLARASAMSIDELEKRIGIDLFCNIPDELEDQVESTYTISDWNGL